MSHTVAVRLAGTILAVILLAGVTLTYLGYTAAFTATDPVTVVSPRAGLVMENDAKVKYRGIQVGKVRKISYDGQQARLQLQICLLYTSPSPRDRTRSRMPSSA